ncbi:unnamed protein product [Ascophyllum nodosum]
MVTRASMGWQRKTRIAGAWSLAWTLAVVVALARLSEGFVLQGGSQALLTASRARGLVRPKRERAVPRPATDMQMHKVTIEHEGKTIVLEVSESTTILDAALDNGIELPHDCKLGVCLTCPSKVVSGEVDQSDGTLDDSVVEQGFALTCCAYPRSDVVIQSIEEDQLVGAQFSDRATS